MKNVKLETTDSITFMIGLQIFGYQNANGFLVSIITGADGFGWKSCEIV